MMSERRICAAARQFEIAGDFSSAERYGSGHINDTYRVAFRKGCVSTPYILQRINQTIFRDPTTLIENIQRVTTHVSLAVAGTVDWERPALRLIPTSDDAGWHIDSEGNFWRAYFFISNATTYDAARNTRQAFQAARAFGRFQEILSSLLRPRLHNTIPNFHNTPIRFHALLKAISADVGDRAILAKPEIEFVLARESMVSALLDADIPERVTHNDTKLNNVMLDDKTGEGICVIDLDTVIPGLILHDFGDMVRTATSPAKEDEKDLSKVTMQFPMFEALVKGYLSSVGATLTKQEKALLACSGKVNALEIGMRFLTDYLEGDRYFKVYRPAHNLDRCRTQFKLVTSIEQQEERMVRLVESMQNAHGLTRWEQKSFIGLLRSRVATEGSR